MKLNLKNVTILAVSSIKIQETIMSLEYSIKDIDFGDVKILTHENPVNLTKSIKYTEIPKISNIMDYNHFVFEELGNYVNTDFCLLIQYDSCIIHPEIWSDEFLKYSYIGAPWKYSETAYITKNGRHIRVGNGGFSIRAKSLLATPKKYHIPLVQEQNQWSEDGNICVYHREQLESLGITYAPVELAAKFSFENWVPENINIKKFFGFHKNYPGV